MLPRALRSLVPPSRAVRRSAFAQIAREIEQTNPSLRRHTKIAQTNWRRARPNPSPVTYEKCTNEFPGAAHPNPTTPCKGRLLHKRTAPLHVRTRGTGRPSRVHARAPGAEANPTRGTNCRCRNDETNPRHDPVTRRDPAPHSQTPGRSNDAHGPPCSASGPPEPSFAVVEGYPRARCRLSDGQPSTPSGSIRPCHSSCS